MSYVAQSGLDSLLEALRQSGMNTDGVGSGAGASGAESVCVDLFPAGSSMKPRRQTAVREKIRFAMRRAPFPALRGEYYSARM